MDLHLFIKNFLAQKNAEAHTMETLAITAGMTVELNPNEAIFIGESRTTNYSYQSADEYTTEAEGNRLTQNVGFVKVSVGTLIATKITITDYQNPLDITLVTNKEKEITAIKVE